jgi:LysM repeat protein
MITLLSGLVLLSASTLAEAATHVVKAGENMFRISLRYGITLSELQAANPGVQPQSLRVGQKLSIPSHGRDSGSTSRAEETPAADLQESTSTAPSDGRNTYSVQAGDNLSKIARLHGTTVAALQAANPKLKANQVVVGQRIVIPAAQTPRDSSNPAAVAKTPEPAPTPAPEPSPTPAPVPAPPKEMTKETPKAIANSNTNPAPKSQQKTISSTETPTPPAATNLKENNQPAAPSATPAYRLIKTTRELTLEQVAQEYKTTTEKINSLNGWNFSPQTLLAVDSELYIPTQP